MTNMGKCAPKPCPTCMQKNPWKNACFETGVVKDHCQNGTSDDCCGSPNTPNAIAAGCKMNLQTNNGEHDFHTPPELIRFEGKKIVNGDIREDRCGKCSEGIEEHTIKQKCTDDTGVECEWISTQVPGTVLAGDPVPRNVVASATFTLAGEFAPEPRYKPKKVFQIGLISGEERICRYVHIERKGTLVGQVRVPRKCDANNATNLKCDGYKDPVHCDGTGRYQRQFALVKCPACHGAGKVERVVKDGLVGIERGSEVTVTLVNRKVTFLIKNPKKKVVKVETIPIDDGPDVQLYVTLNAARVTLM